MNCVSRFSSAKNHGLGGAEIGFSGTLLFVFGRVTLATTEKNEKEGEVAAYPGCLF